MKILSYDIESTTGNHNDGSMCSFGFCLSNERFEILYQEDVVMNPKTRRFENRIPLHYEKSFIKSQPRFPSHYEKIKGLFLDKDIIIGFSVSNDVDFLNNACEVYGLEKIDYEFLDVQLLYKTVFKKPTLSALSSIAEELGIEYKAHRSDEDARVTLLVLKHIVEYVNLPILEILRKYSITLGSNKNGESIPCTNGTLTKKEINYLLLKFVEKHYHHSRRYKGGLSYKTFAFQDEIRYGDIDKFRQIIKRIYDLNGRISSIESSNVFVKLDDKELSDKYKKAIDERNKDKKRITVITLSELLKTIKELPKLDFSSDAELIKEHRLEILNNRKKRRLERIAQLKKPKVETEENKEDKENKA